MPFWADRIEWLGRQSYRPLHRRMVQKRDQILDGDPSPVIWLAQHEPVITLGKHAKSENVLHPRETLLHEEGIDVVEIERGGDATYHGPSQLMVYPIGKIGNVVDFLSGFSDVFIELLTGVGVIGACWQKNPAGVWVGGRKVVACGLHVRKQVVMHGFALNVQKTHHWKHIHPCGLKGSVPTSIEEETSKRLDISEFAMVLKDALSQKFCK